MPTQILEPGPNSWSGKPLTLSQICALKLLSKFWVCCLPLGRDTFGFLGFSFSKWLQWLYAKICWLRPSAIRRAPSWLLRKLLQAVIPKWQRQSGSVLRQETDRLFSSSETCKREKLRCFLEIKSSGWTSPHKKRTKSHVSRFPETSPPLAVKKKKNGGEVIDLSLKWNPTKHWNITEIHQSDHTRILGSSSLIMVSSKWLVGMTQISMAASQMYT